MLVTRKFYVREFYVSYFEAHFKFRKKGNLHYVTVEKDSPNDLWLTWLVDCNPYVTEKLDNPHSPISILMNITEQAMQIAQKYSLNYDGKILFIERNQPQNDMIFNEIFESLKLEKLS